MGLFDRIADALEAGSQTSSADTKFADRYMYDPVAFAHECFVWSAGQSLTPYQEDVLARIVDKNRVAVRGPHGLGKSAVASIATLWFALTRDAAGVDWKVPTTASVWRQVEKYLWPEIHKWARRLNPAVIGRPLLNERTELLTLNLKLRHGAAFPVVSDKPEQIEGAHADSILYIFDEAKAIAADIFEGAEGAFSGAGQNGLEAYALAISTPGEPSGTFYDIHRRAPGLEDWHARHVTLEETIAAGRISARWAEQREKQWGRDSAVFHNRVLGEFYSSDEDGVIPLSWVEAANERWRAWDEAGRPESDGPRTVGVDVARSGSDSTVMALRHGDVVTEIRRGNREDTMATVGRVRGILDTMKSGTAVVDVIGIGAGVVDRLRELRYDVDGFNASEGTKRRDASGELGFKNSRSAAWWNLREMLDPSTGPEIALPPDDLLVGDLTAPHWRVVSGGKIQVESKDDIRPRLGRSTDTGDAVVQCFWYRDMHVGDAYGGPLTCEKCRRMFLRELHPEKCPFCSHQHG